MSTPAQIAGGPDQRGWRRSRTVLAVVLVTLSGYTAATAAFPALRVALLSPDLRVIIEVLDLSAALAAATALWLGVEEPLDSARGGFMSAMVALAVSNAVFIVAAILLADELAFGSAVGLYAWLQLGFCSSWRPFAVPNCPSRLT